MIQKFENLMKLYRAARTLESESTDNSTTSEYKTLAIAALLDEISRTCCDLARATHADAEQKRIEAACKAAARKLEAKGSRRNTKAPENTPQENDGEGGGN